MGIIFGLDGIVFIQVDLEEQTFAQMIERAEVMLGIRVIAFAQSQNWAMPARSTATRSTARMAGIRRVLVAGHQMQDALRHHSGGVDGFGPRPGEIVEAASLVGLVSHGNLPQSKKEPPPRVSRGGGIDHWPVAGNAIQPGHQSVLAAAAVASAAFWSFSLALTNLSAAFLPERSASIPFTEVRSRIRSKKV